MSRWELAMSEAALVGIVIVALVIVVVIAWYAVSRRHRSAMLHAQYGSEYDRTVAHAENRREAEAELVDRQERVEHFDIRPLSADQRELFIQQWHDVQEAFVDNPARAVTKADGLVVEVMRERGYPVTDFDQRASDLSVHHAAFVESYRAARDIAGRHRRATATTEELRRAMVYYREMFDDLLEPERTITDRPVDRVVERELPLSGDRRLGSASERGERRPIAPPPSDRETR
jgi:hypothetical protein